MAVAPTVRTTCRGASKAVAKVFYAKLITTSAWKLKSSIATPNAKAALVRSVPASMHGIIILASSSNRGLNAPYDVMK
jgi:hypothetical protein